ncbi:hypothetical protein Tco_1362578 [Tanacetum coccineum]
MNASNNMVDKYLNLSIQTILPILHALVFRVLLVEEMVRGPVEHLKAGQKKPKENDMMRKKAADLISGPQKYLTYSPNDEEDTRSSQEYMDNREEEYQARALLAKSKRFFKKVTFSTKTSQFLSAQTRLRPTKDFEAKYNKIKAKLALLSLSVSASKASMVKNKGLIVEAYDEQIPTQKKRILGVDHLTKDPSSSGQKELVFVKSSADDIKVSIHDVERPWLFEVEGFILPNHDTGRIPPAELQRNITDPPVVVTDSSASDYDSVDESLVYSTPLPPLEKVAGAEPVSRPKTVKSILKSNL